MICCIINDAGSFNMTVYKEIGNAFYSYVLIKMNRMLLSVLYNGKDVLDSIFVCFGCNYEL